MDIKEIRRLLKEGHSVVLFEDGQSPLVVSELSPAQSSVSEPVEVPISSRWPKVSAENRSFGQAQDRQDQVLERLNKEILALKEQIAQEESVG